MAWAYERDDGGRGFGFTGGHTHKNWANDDFRRLVTNAILWAARVDVPEAGAKVEMDPAAWRADATAERIHFAPGILSTTMRYTNRPSGIQQVISFNGHR